MLKRLSNILHRGSSVYTFILVTLLYAFFIASVMPQQSLDSAMYAGDWGAPDRHFFYTPNELYTSLSTWGDEGRLDYIEFRLGADIIWALAYAGFLITLTSICTRKVFTPTDWRQRFNLVAVVPLLADYTENSLGIWLVSAWPERLDTIAWLAAVITSIKWTSLVIAHLILIYVLLAWLRGMAAAWKN